MMRRPMLIWAAVAVAAACGNENEEKAREPAPASEPPVRAEKEPKQRQARDAVPSIRILTPARGENVGSSVAVEVSIENFKVVPQHTRPPFPSAKAGKGHVHFYLDADRLPTVHGPPATGVYRSVSTTTYTWTGVAPGRHSLGVQLVGRDHAPLRPAVKDRVTVEVG